MRFITVHKVFMIRAERKKKKKKEERKQDKKRERRTGTVELYKL